MENKELLYKNPLNLTEEEISKLSIKKAARAVIVKDDNKIILIKESNGLHCLPGGTVEDNESIHEALYRECREEAGYDVEIIKELGYIKIIKKDYVSVNFGFLVKAIGEQQELLLTQEEKDLGYELEEYTLDRAIEIFDNEFIKYNKIDYRSYALLKEIKNNNLL